MTLGVFSCIREVVIGEASGDSFCVDGLLLVFIQHLVTMMYVGCIASSLDDDWLLVRLSLVGLAWSPDFVILGGTHMESRFCHFVFRCGVHSSGRVWCILSCVWLSGCWLCDHLGVGRQALHPPSPPATSALAATSSEEEGLHARPLPHTFGEYFCVDAAYHGGGRIGTLPSSSQWRGVLRRRRDRPFSSQFRRVLRRGRDRPSPSQRRYVRRLLDGRAVQVVRGQDRAGSLTVGKLRRYHQSELVYVLHTGAGRNRSGRFATPCSGCVKQPC